MDARGWIQIELLASFNRVRSLTTETQLVVEVLGLSSIVEVREMYVRPRQWQQFVLPTAAPSAVEGLDPLAVVSPSSELGAAPAAPASGGAGQNNEGEEEEDVVFILST